MNNILKVTLLLCISAVAVVFAMDTEMISNAMLEEIQTLKVDELDSASKEITTQSKIDAIIKAFRRLPNQELERLEIDLDQPILENTKESEVLLQAWKQRQLELKEAMKTILQPAEYMGNLTKQLNNTESDFTLSTSDKEYLLSELVSLLDDVDNARDFHTIGAWPTLVRHLSHTQAKSLRAYAALGIGNAVKNTYDYQLWTLEKIVIEEHASVDSSNVGIVHSCIELLIDMLDPAELPEIDTVTTSSSNYDTQKRALYAIASSIRGNLDVQSAVLAIRSDDSIATKKLMTQSSSVKYLDYMYFLGKLYNTGIPSDVSKKVWSSLADLLEERTYIHNELNSDLKVLEQQQAHTRNYSNPIDIDLDNPKINSTPKEEFNHLQATVLLGDYLLLDPKWFNLSTDMVIYYVNRIKEYYSANKQNFRQTNDFNAMHSSLHSVLIFCKELLNTRDEIQSIIPQQFVDAVNYILEHFDKEVFEDLMDISLQIHNYIAI